MRPPTGLEIKASVWLAVAFGAKGIIGYPYGTHEWTDGVDAWTYTGLLSSDTGSDGIRRDHSANTATIDGSTVYTGYSEKWKGYKGVLAKLKDLGPTLASLHWQGAFYRRTWGTSMPAQFQMVGATTVTNVTTSDPAADTFVEVAHLKDDASVDYLVVVNLRTLASDARDVRVFFNGPKLVSRVGSDSSWFVGSGGSFVDRIAPGDGNLYKVEALNIAMTFGHVPSNTEYFITPGNTFHFGSGQSLYVTGTLTAIGTTSEPINFTTSDTNTFWSGINFYGSGASNSRIRNVSISNCSGYGVQVNGATGVTIENATINGNSNSQTGVWFTGGSSVTLSSSTIQNCVNGHGIFISGNSGPTVDACTIQNNKFDGVLVSTNYTPPLITASSILNNGIVGSTRTYFGVDIYNATAVVRENTVQGSLYGVVASNYGTVYGYRSGVNEYGCNSVTGNTYGLLA